MGPDGTARSVRKLVRGQEPLYRITMGGRKEDLVVTSNHILVMYRYNEAEGLQQYEEVEFTAIQLARMTGSDFAKLRMAQSPSFDLLEAPIPVDPINLASRQSEGTLERLSKIAVSFARSVGSAVLTCPKNAIASAGPSMTSLRAGNPGRRLAAGRLMDEQYSVACKSISLETTPSDWYGFKVDVDQRYLRHDYLVLHNSGFEESYVHACPKEPNH